MLRAGSPALICFSTDITFAARIPIIQGLSMKCIKTRRAQAKQTNEEGCKYRGA
jgi:hypothetical protein